MEYKNIGNSDTAFYYGIRALKLAKQLNYFRGIATAYNNFGAIYHNQSDYNKALENYFFALKIRREINDQRGIAASYNNIGLVYYDQANLYKAMEYHLAALKIKEAIDDKQGIVASYNNIGMVYDSQSNYSEALSNYFAALKIAKEVNDKYGVALLYNNIGTIYHKQGDFREALSNHLASLRMREETGDKQGIAASYNNIGMVYDSHDNYPEALKNYFAALKILEEMGDKYGVVLLRNNIGVVYGKLKQPLRAEEYYSKALAIAKEIGSKEDIKESYQNLSEIFAMMNDYKKAYQYHQLYSQINDSIFGRKFSRQISELQTKYETEKKEKEIKLLNNENEIKSLRIKEQEHLLLNHRILFTALFTGIILIVAISWLLISRNKIRQKEILKTELLKQQELRTQAIIETQEHERKRIAQNLHDGTGHKLTILKINLEKIAGIFFAASPEQKIIFEQTKNIVDETHKEVRTLSHAMMPKALQEREFTGAVSELVEQTLANSRIKYSLINDLTKDLSENIRICLYRVLQELLNNILKHAQATKVAIQIFKNKNTIIMMVEDDGIGIQPLGTKISSGRKTHTTLGIGLQNIAGRVNALNGTFTIEPGPSKGTIATVRIPG